MSDANGQAVGTECYLFVLVPNFSMIAFATALEPLRLANRTVGRSIYSWKIVSKDGGPVAASNGVAVAADGGLGDFQPERLSPMPAVVLCSGLKGERYQDREMLAWLRRCDRRGAEIGALCTGAHILARAGLLTDHRCTIHWENLPGFVEDFPDVPVTSDLYEIDRNRFTCSGGTAAIDMMLNVISLQHGYELAAQVADQFMHERIRDRHDQQRMSLPARLGVRHPKLLSIIEIMEKNLEEPLARGELAEHAGLSTRQLERLFRKYLNRSPARYYLELRLNRARLLLLQTNMSVIDVALACGFVSPSHFSKCYRDFFGKTPRRERSLPAGPQDAPLNAA